MDGAVAFFMAQICSNEHDETERLGHGICAFLLGNIGLFEKWLINDFYQAATSHGYFYQAATSHGYFYQAATSHGYFFQVETSLVCNFPSLYYEPTSPFESQSSAHIVDWVASEGLT